MNVLRWPLWSWRNLAAALAVVVVALFVVGHLSAPATADPTPVAAPTTAPVAEDPVPTYTPGPPTTPAPQPTKDVRLDMIATVQGFMGAWARPQLAQSEWLAGVTPWVTPAMAKSLATTDPARVPATKILGEPVLRQYDQDGWRWAFVDVNTDGGKLVVSLSSVTLEPQIRRWTVTDISPAGEGAP